LRRKGISVRKEFLEEERNFCKEGISVRKGISVKEEIFWRGKGKEGKLTSGGHSFKEKRRKVDLWRA